MNKLIYIFILLFLNILQIKSAKVDILDENSSDQKYSNRHYLNSYRVPSSMILCTSNGKSDDSHPLRNAFDGNFDSYWQSSLPQKEGFSNNVKISFSKTVSIDRIIFQAPSFDNIIGNGYPTELKIYSKLKNPDGTYSKNDTDFLLIDDIISERTGERVLFTLDQVIECDQIILEWSQIEQADYSSEIINAFASEIILLFPENEYLNKLLFDVFDDNNYYKMNINSEYKDLLVIQEIEENIQDYLFTYKYIRELIERAKKIIEGEIEYDKRREFTTDPNAETNKINQYGDIYGYTKNILKMKKGGTNRQPTGIYAFGGEKITVFVEADDGDPLPRIQFTQYVGKYNDWEENQYPLKKGINIINAGKFDMTGVRDKIKSGGPIYLYNGYTPEEQSSNVKIYIDGGKLFPLFRINDNEEDFKKTLSDYISDYYVNILDYFDIAEFYSDKIIITLNATYAQEVYNYQKESPQDNLLNWDKELKSLYTSKGIGFESSQPNYDIRNEYIKIHIRYSSYNQSDFETYSYGQHIGIYSQAQFQKCLASYQGMDKNIMDEIGNIIDISP